MVKKDAAEAVPQEIDLDALVAEVTYAPYRYRLDGGWHELPHVQMLDTEQALRIESGDGHDVIRELAGSDLVDRLMKLPAHAMNALLNGWIKHGGTEPGESQASAGS